MTLAVVDDDVDVRTALRRLLRSLGHHVTVYASAEEFEAQPVMTDCLILDIRLPGLNGLELRDRMQANGYLPPIVFITGNADPGFGDDRSHDVTILHKPFDEESLSAAIADALSAAQRSR